MPRIIDELRYRSIQQWRNCFFRESLGSYDPLTQLVELPSISDTDLKELAELWAEHSSTKFDPFPPKLYEAAKKVHTVTAHEYTHFLDASATVWGAKLLLNLYRTYSLENDETQYFIAKSTDDDLRSMKMPSYYSLLDHNVIPSRPWRYLVTSGSVFDKEGKNSLRQITFVRFFNSSEETLSRVPISLLSMLEASATYQELIAHAQLIARLSPDLQLVENAVFSKSVIDRLYDPNLTEYSVCTHYLADWHGITDVLVAYKYTAALARFCLNISSADIKSLTITERVALDLRLTELEERKNMEDRLNHSLALGDRTILFSVLVRACDIPVSARNRLPSKQDISSILSDALTKFDRNLADFCSSAATEFIAINTEMENISCMPQEIISSGLHNFYAQEEIYNVDLSFPKMELPPALYKNLVLKRSFLGSNVIFRDFDANSHFEAVAPRIDWFREFCGACI